MNKKKWDSYTDEDNMLFAKSEYVDFNIGSPYTIGSTKQSQVAGYVQQKYGFDQKGNNDTSCEGMQAYVVTPHANQAPKDVKQVAVVYQGSNSDLKSKDGQADWINNDSELAFSIEFNRMGIGEENKAMIGSNVSTVPSQLKASAITLDQVCEKYPNAKVRVYGHSLGSMDGQYALAATKHPQQIDKAYLYEGPNVYPDLSDKQQKQADSMRNRVFNYQDSKDFVSIGYDSFDTDTIGKLIHVDGQRDVNADISTQHMWHGYQFTKDGKLKTLSDDENLRSTPINMAIRGENAIMSIMELLEGLGKSTADLVDNIADVAGEKIKVLPSEIETLSNRLISVVENEVKTMIQKIEREAEHQFESTYREAKRMAYQIGKDLTSSEIDECLHAAGITHSNMVTKPVQKIKQQTKKLLAAANEVKGTGQKGLGIGGKFTATDNGIGGLFS